MKNKLFVVLFLAFSAVGFCAEEPPALLSTDIPHPTERLVEFGLDVQYVPVSYQNYQWVNGRTSDKGGHGVHLAAEWIPFDDRYGKVGFGLGAGFLAIVNSNFNGVNATLTTIPTEMFVSYRFDYIPNQIVVPFIKTGPSLVFATQKGIEIPGWRRYVGWEFAGGLQVCLNKIDGSAARGLRKNGISNSYLIAEYNKSAQLSGENTPDLSNGMFRLGFRFEM